MMNRTIFRKTGGGTMFLDSHDNENDYLTKKRK